MILIIAWCLEKQIPKGSDVEATRIYKAIQPIQMKPCTITPQTNLELEATVCTQGMGKLNFSLPYETRGYIFFSPD